MLNKIFKLLTNPRLLKMLLSMNSSGYLKDIGWINSFSRGMPLDYVNNPIPWTTYSFIGFISNRLNSNMEIFEYGSGNSTQ